MIGGGRRRAASLAAGVSLLICARPAGATGFTDVGDDLAAATGRAFVVHGALRARGEALYNLDLDAGLTPSGDPYFPVPASDPDGQILTTADLRFRADVALRATGWAARLRVDVLHDSVIVRRAYGEALTPLGLLAVGRMGSQWGLGMLVNGGDCEDCDAGDRADRVAFVSPLAGHLFAVAFDVGGSGPAARRKGGTRRVDIDPTDDVRAVTVAVLRWRNDWARERRGRAGKSTLDYGAYGSHQWQTNDAAIGYRGYRATAFDVWFRLTTPHLRLETEAAILFGRVDQPSLVPGVLLRDGIELLQYGAALECDVGSPDGAVWAGLDAGFASGDPAPGFGAFPELGDPAAQPGDLDGPQAAPPRDRRVDNLRFHPEYHVDRILFREIIGTVTDAAYVRPRLAWRAIAHPAGSLVFELAAVASLAIEPASAPGGARPLGVELDPGLRWNGRDGFTLAAEYAVLFPLDGLDGAMPARAAQLFRVRGVWSY